MKPHQCAKRVEFSIDLEVSSRLQQERIPFLAAHRYQELYEPLTMAVEDQAHYSTLLRPSIAGQPGSSANPVYAKAA